MTIEMPKRGSTPSDMVSWGGHVCLLYETIQINVPRS
jgi:hypothetical protein